MEKVRTLQALAARVREVVVQPLAGAVAREVGAFQERPCELRDGEARERQQRRVHEQEEGDAVLVDEGGEPAAAPAQPRHERQAHAQHEAQRAEHGVGHAARLHERHHGQTGQHLEHQHGQQHALVLDHAHDQRSGPDDQRLGGMRSALLAAGMST